MVGAARRRLSIEPYWWFPARVGVLILITARHRTPLGRLVALAIGGSLLVCPTAVIARDAGPARAGDPADARWLPALSIQTGIFVNERTGEASSVERGIIDGQSTQLYGAFGSSAQLSTPRLALIPGRPRFFARADVYFSADDKESLASEGVPENPLVRFGDGYNLEAGAVEQVVGRGTALRTQSEPLVLGAGVGLSLETEVLGRKLRFKPSIEWMFQRDEIRLEFSDVEGNGTALDRCQPQCRAVSIRAQDTQAYHSLGPGAELDYDVGRAGAFRVSVFTRFQALAILGEKTSRLEARGSWFTRTVDRIDGRDVITSIDPASGRADTTVSSRYEREAWTYFAGAGFRVYWDPR